MYVCTYVHMYVHSLHIPAKRMYVDKEFALLWQMFIESIYIRESVTRKYAYIHTHTYTYVYTNIYMYVCLDNLTLIDDLLLNELILDSIGGSGRLHNPASMREKFIYLWI